MHFSMVLAMAGVAFAATEYKTGTIQSPHALMARQDVDCISVPVGPNLCERSCGPGYVSCVYDTMCYNPSMGQSCCSNGRYCNANEYCSDNGCCDEDWSLEECGATSEVSTIAPPSEDTPTPTPSTEDTPTPTPTSEDPPTSDDDPTPSTSSTPPYPTPSDPEEPTMPTGTSGLPTPSPSDPIFTGAADVNAHGVGGYALGGLGLLAMWL